MYRAMADYGVLKGDALWLARAALNPSRLVASVTKTKIKMIEDEMSLFNASIGISIVKR